MHTNQGHRQRVKDRFRKEGLDSFEEVHVLELLLFYAVAQKDTKPLARCLLDRFGSLAAVLSASREELETVPGVGENIATFLTLVTETGRYYRTAQAKEEIKLDSVDSYGAFFLEKLFGRRKETVCMVCLDAKCKMLTCQIVGEGDVNSAKIPIRRMVEIALGANATSVILAHNHPSGIAVPSKEDYAATENLAKALGAMGIVLLDHVVVADDDYISMVLSGSYNPRYYCDQV